MIILMNRVSYGEICLNEQKSKWWQFLLSRCTQKNRWRNCAALNIGAPEFYIRSHKLFVSFPLLLCIRGR